MIKVQLEGAAELVQKLNRMGIDVDQVLPIALKAGAVVIQRAANKDAPGPHVEIGDIEKSKGRMEIDIGPDKEHWYYKFAETGAKPHKIEAVDARALRFVDGTMRKRADHPGFAARPFLRPAVDENVPQTSAAVGDEIKKVLR